VTVVDLFAGMGGWDLAARDLGIDPLGIEWNTDACATREAAGLRTLQADIAALDPADFAPCEGLIASPPCQDFSVAGKGAGRGGDRGQLVDEVPRWVDALRPRWVACEQVPPVLPIWREFAHRFEQWGYRTWCGVLSAETFGVPQTRKRAILMASLDGPFLFPSPTHQRYRHGAPAQQLQSGLFGDLMPWVSMAEALGWGMTERPGMTVPTNRDRGGDPDCAGGSGARWVLHGERGRGAWKVGFPRRDDTGTSHDGYRERDFRADSEPSFALTEKGRSWVRLRDLDLSLEDGVLGGLADVPLGHVDEGVGDVSDDFLAGGVGADLDGDGVFHEPQHDEPAEDVKQEDAIRLTVPEGLILQGFPPDWPVQGTKTAQWLQIGNAIPPPLAKAILAQLVPAHEATA
jgi:DNA (cytosine-5)-methyltransferase 1